jgi:hypothetical protein
LWLLSKAEWKTPESKGMKWKGVASIDCTMSTMFATLKDPKVGKNKSSPVDEGMVVPMWIGHIEAWNRNGSVTKDGGMTGAKKIVVSLLRLPAVTVTALTSAITTVNLNVADCKLETLRPEHLIAKSATALSKDIVEILG